MVWEDGVVRPLESSDIVPAGRRWEVLWAGSESRQ